MNWRLALLTFPGLLLAACGDAPDSVQNNATAGKDGLIYYNKTDRCSCDLGESVKILYRVTNRGNQAREIGTVPNCEYCICQFRIARGREEVWRSCRVIPPCGLKSFALSPGGSREYTLAWNMINDNGTLDPDDDFEVPRGTYGIVADLQLSGGITKVPLCVSIDFK